MTAPSSEDTGRRPVSESSTGTNLLEHILQIAQEEAQNPLRFKYYENDPDGFAKEVLGVTLWSKQLEILEATRNHRRVAVKSGHGVGKTFSMAVLILWWLYARQGLVVSTAPSKEHVEQVLWREVRMLAANAKLNLPGEQFLTERKVTADWNAVGITAKDSTSFQGRHHPRLLAIVDEAVGVSEDIHLAISTLATGDQNCIVMIGNPTSTSGTFYSAFKTDSDWHQIHVSCFDHPNVKAGEEVIPGAVTRAWIEGRRKLWGEHHPFWYSRVLGVFPKLSSKGVIPLGWIERAQDEEQRRASLEKAEKARIPRVGGLDVARYGDNNCVLIIRRGDAIEYIESWNHSSITETARRAEQAISHWQLKTLMVDSAGVGGGVTDILLEKGLPAMSYNGGHRAFSPGSFSNRRSEMWWHLRSRLEHMRLWLPIGCDRLVDDLVQPEYDINRSGRLQVETKEQLLDAGKPSPDWADALVLCFAMDADPEAFLEDVKNPRLRDVQEVEWIPVEEEDGFSTLPRGF